MCAFSRYARTCAGRFDVLARVLDNGFRYIVPVRGRSGHTFRCGFLTYFGMEEVGWGIRDIDIASMTSGRHFGREINRPSFLCDHTGVKNNFDVIPSNLFSFTDIVDYIVITSFRRVITCYHPLLKWRAPRVYFPSLSFMNGPVSSSQVSFNLRLSVVVFNCII